MNILIVAGGKSAEEKISVLTAIKVYRALKSGSKFCPSFVYYHPVDECFYAGKGVLQLENYTTKKQFKKVQFKKFHNRYFYKCGGKKVFFDIVLPLVHGENAEDGTMSAFFTVLGYPVLASPISAASLSQDKILFKDFLRGIKINTPRARHLTIRDYQNNLLDISSVIRGLHFPLIIKPYNLGSSIGVTRVTSIEVLLKALHDDFELTDKIIIEEYLDEAVEVNIALIIAPEEIKYSAIEKIVKETEDIYSFEEKYLNKPIKKEVPAILTPEIEAEIKKVATRVYLKMGLAGPVRFDFLIQNEIVYLNEINAIPGNWSANILSMAGISISDTLDIFLRESSERIKKNLNSHREKGTFSEIDEASRNKFN